MNYPDQTPLFCDNQSAIKLVRNPEFHKRTKHIEVRHHFIREQQDLKIVNVQYLETEAQLADILTKPLPQPRFSNLRNAMGIRSVNDAMIEGGC